MIVIAGTAEDARLQKLIRYLQKKMEHANIYYFNYLTKPTSDNHTHVAVPEGMVSIRKLVGVIGSHTDCT